MYVAHFACVPHFNPRIPCRTRHQFAMYRLIVIEPLIHASARDATYMWHTLHASRTLIHASLTEYDIFAIQSTDVYDALLPMHSEGDATVI